MKRSTKAAGWAAIAVACVGTFEGLRTVAYRDPVGIPTICFGETRGVRMGDRSTPEECKALLIDRLQEFNDGVNRCVYAPMSDSRRAAVVSLAYNIGTGAFCSSTFARKLNAGDPTACDELLKWDRAKGIRLPGLTRRRMEERTLCLG
jgi:lysozyme